jgi:hypothetical protein
MRSEAQKRADKNYRESHEDLRKPLQFKLPVDERKKIEAVISGSGMTKADFLRGAAKAFEEKKWM